MPSSDEATTSMLQLEKNLRFSVGLFLILGLTGAGCAIGVYFDYLWAKLLCGVACAIIIFSFVFNGYAAHDWSLIGLARGLRVFVGLALWHTHATHMGGSTLTRVFHVGAGYDRPLPGEKLGISFATLTFAPLNALRQRAEAGTCGWHVWGCEELSNDRAFFSPLHVSHVEEYCASIEVDVLAGGLTS